MGSVSIVEKIRNDMSRLLSRGSSKEMDMEVGRKTPVDQGRDLERGGSVDSNVDMVMDTEQCQHVAIQIVKTPSREQVQQKRRRWTWGSSKVVAESQISQRKHATLSSENGEGLSDSSLKRCSVNLKRNKASAAEGADEEDEFEDSRSELSGLGGLEEMSILSMGLKRSKTSHKVMLELDTAVINEGSSYPSSLYSA